MNESFINIASMISVTNLDDAWRWLQTHSQGELGYVFLIVLLFVVPRLLLRFGIPMALTAFAIGVGVSYGFRFYDEDNVIPLFSTLGIISLFLFAGVEVNLDSIKKALRPISIHVSVRILVVTGIALVVSSIYGLSSAVALILALALATPSTGFILDSIETSKASDNQKYWIKLKAISAELVALGALLIFSQMENLTNLASSLAVIVLLILILPFIIKKLASTLERLAPGSEFGFILMLAIISGLITKKLGAYYLVGAFLVGIVAGQYKRHTPNANTDQMLLSLRSFSAFFIPFYFFNSGLKIAHEAFSIDALLIALVLLIISGPIKIGSIILHRRLTMNEPWKDSLAIAISLMPNLVFGLVLAEILKTKMDLPIEIFGGLIIYTLFITLLAPMVIKLLPENKQIEVIVDAESAGFSNSPRLS
ncbi:MAG: cation:proton antiporter [Bdellovibrionales bacterium]|nr:cation:proton antiporter [Bdellovibrionales bacterium]